MLTGEAKKKYQREYMREYMKRKRVKTQTEDVKTSERKCLDPVKTQVKNVKTQDDNVLRPSDTVSDLRGLINGIETGVRPEQLDPVQPEYDARYVRGKRYETGTRVLMPNGEVQEAFETDMDGNRIW